jgi:hypothetical protein
MERAFPHLAEEGAMNRGLKYFMTGGPAFARSFRLFSALGFGTSILFCRYRQGKTQEIEISHTDYDGMNGLVAQLKKAGTYEENSFPVIPARKRSFLPWTLLRRFLHYFRVLWQFSRKSQEWKELPRKVSQPILVWNFFSAEETESIRATARANKVSMNSHLFYTLNDTVKPYLAPSGKAATWIIPVSLYSSSEQAQTPGMRTSIMEVGLVPSDTPATTNEKVRRELESESYWGAIVAVLINHPLPASINRAILSATVASKRRVGTFSNLGKWRGRDTSADEAWSVVPPVHAGQPFGVGAIEYNGKLGLGMQFDPFLGLDEHDAEAVMKEFMSRLRRKDTP